MEIMIHELRALRQSVDALASQGQPGRSRAAERQSAYRDRKRKISPEEPCNASVTLQVQKRNALRNADSPSHPPFVPPSLSPSDSPSPNPPIIPPYSPQKVSVNRYQKGTPGNGHEKTGVAMAVTQYIAEKTGVAYRVPSEQLNARSKEVGYDELVLVFDHLFEQWSDDPNVSKFLDTVTPYRPQKFPTYLAKAEAWQAAGRPFSGKRKTFRDATPQEILENTLADMGMDTGVIQP